MIADPWLRWVLAALFLCSGGYCAWRLTRPGNWRGRVGHTFHLLMCLSMLAMIWPGTPTVPYSAQIVVFAVATAWFGVLAFARPPRYQGMTGFLCASGRATTCYHTAMMAAMLWMAVLMGGWLVGGAQTAQAAPGMGAMAGMDMPGMSMDSAAPHAEHHAPAWISVSDVLLGVLFFAAALWWVRRYFEQRRNPGRSAPAEAELLCEVAMALGMGIMTLAMA